jgi:hypothetical protein
MKKMLQTRFSSAKHNIRTINERDQHNHYLKKGLSGTITSFNEDSELVMVLDLVTILYTFFLSFGSFG